MISASKGDPAAADGQDAPASGGRGAPGGPRRRAPGADLLALGVALAALAAIAAAIGTPLDRSTDQADPPVRALLVDTSASVTRARPGWRRWAVKEVARATRDAGEVGHEVALVTYDGSVQRRFGPGAADELLEQVRSGAGADWFESTPAGDLATDLEGAARAALEVLSSGDRPPGQIVVLGDGTATGADPSFLLLDPRVGQLRLVTPEPASLTDFALVAVHAPREVEPGARVPIQLDATLGGPDPRSSDGGELVVEWELRLRSAEAAVASSTLRGVDRFSVPPGSRRRTPAGDARSVRLAFELPPLASGTGELSVRGRLGAAIESGGTDPFPENDVVATSFSIGDPVRALIVVAEGGPSADEVQFSGQPFDGIELQIIGPTEVARALHGDRPPDAIVTLDVPLAGLPAAELAAFVTAGGGWVHCGGWSFLRADAPELADLVALEPDREPREPRDIVFFVDGSGSMRGGRWERVRSALGELVPTAAPDDRLELRFFTQVMGEPQLVFEVPGGGPSESGEIERRQDAVRALLSARVPGGATDIVGSLVSLAEVRERTRGGAGEREGLCVLLTDGVTNSVSGLRGSVRDRLAACGDRMVVIQVGDDRQGTRFLKGFLRPGETLIRAGELEDLLDILQEAVQDVRLVEGERVVAPDGPSPAGWMADVLEATLAATELDTPLVVARALRCRAASGATPLLEIGALAGERAVLAAVAPRGLGTVCGVAVPYLGRGLHAWSPGLRRRSAWLAPVLRGMARRADEAPADSRTSRPSASLEDGGRSLVVRGLPDGVPARIDARLAMGPTLDPFGTLLDAVPFDSVRFGPPDWEVDPGRVRAAARPLALDDVPRGTILEVDLGRGIGPLTFVADGPAEIRSPSSTPANGGTVRAFEISAGSIDAGRAAGPLRAGRGPHPLTPWLAAGALIALFFGALGGRGALRRG